jgi:hypothetical protein
MRKSAEKSNQDISNLNLEKKATKQNKTKKTNAVLLLLYHGIVNLERGITHNKCYKKRALTF